MTDYVRVLVPREGAADLHRTTSVERAEAMGWELVDEPTHDSSGRVRADTRADGRPLKPKTTVDQAAADAAPTPPKEPVTGSVVPAVPENSTSPKEK